MFAIVICLVLLMCTLTIKILKFCVVCIDDRRYACCGECNVVSNECNVQSIELVWTLDFK